jgi:hypothetical protein
MSKPFFSLNTNRLNWWFFYFFTFFYITIEFGFNYQLLNLTVDFASEETLLGLEFWGRVISGIGLSLVLYRSSSGLKIFNGLRYILCLILGIALMWNVQKMLTDYLVEQANLEDKEVSLLLATLSPKAAEGSLATLSGNLIINEPLSEQDRKITASLFPAIALYAPNRNEQIAAWNELHRGTNLQCLSKFTYSPFNPWDLYLFCLTQFGAVGPNDDWYLSKTLGYFYLVLTPFYANKLHSTFAF